MLQELFDLAQLTTESELDGFLVMSSSEIYGDPHPDWIPTPRPITVTYLASDPEHVTTNQNAFLRHCPGSTATTTT